MRDASGCRPSADVPGLGRLGESSGDVLFARAESETSKNGDLKELRENRGIERRGAIEIALTAISQNLESLEVRRR